MREVVYRETEGEMKRGHKRAATLEVVSCHQELRAGLEAVRQEYPRRFGGAEALKVAFQRDGQRGGGGLEASMADGVVVIRYGRVIDAFRAFGRLMGQLQDGQGFRGFAETPRFAMLGMMWDVSRNGVLQPAAARALLLRCALMGINVAMLYAEDVYEIPGEPFFGYLRGPYTCEELRSLDDFAASLGIEMFPCIQTLAHLDQALKWPAYAERADVPGVLLAEDDATYALVEKMLQAASAPFRSRRVHVGMDEAHGLGSGRYRQRHGEKCPFDILTQHLERVRGICAKLGLSPMIWGDMFFRFASSNHDYYDSEFSFPERVKRSIPSDVKLVYWDYYHTDADFYRRFIGHHRALGAEPAMAGGLWTWHRFWAQLPYAALATDACMRACKTEGVQEVFMTAWGDDGNECDPFSALAGLQHFAEHGHADKVDPDLLRANFRGSCDASLDAWFRAGSMDCPGGVKPGDPPPLSLTKALLWDDPLLGLTDGQFGAFPPQGHYESMAVELAEAAQSGQEGMRRLLFPAALANAVAFKRQLRQGLVTAYRGGDRAELRKLADATLPATVNAVWKLWKIHRRMWASTYKPFGFEVLEGRYGALLARLDHLAERLGAFLDGGLESIPELEVEHHDYQVNHKLGYHPDITYGKVATASSLR